MPNRTEVEIVCPKCGSADIRERNVAYAELPVLAWERDEYGQVAPADYDTDESPEWETEDVSQQYVCFRCRHRMSLDDLESAVVSDV